MLLLNMTHAEVQREVLCDLPNVLQWERHQWRDFRKRTFRTRQFPAYFFSEYVSPRRNNWIITTKIFKKGDFASAYGILQIQNGLVLHQAAFHRSDRDGRDPTLCTFIPHFFERYAQYNNLGLKGKALIKYFLTDDYSFNVDKTQAVSGRKERDRDDNVHICMDGGVGLGYEVGRNYYLIKTFITYDMSVGRQKEVFEHRRDATSIQMNTSLPPLLPRPENPVIDIPEKEIQKLKRKLGIQ